MLYVEHSQVTADRIRQVLANVVACGRLVFLDCAGTDPADPRPAALLRLSAGKLCP